MQSVSFTPPVGKCSLDHLPIWLTVLKVVISGLIVLELFLLYLHQFFCLKGLAGVKYCCRSLPISALNCCQLPPPSSMNKFHPQRTSSPLEEQISRGPNSSPRGTSYDNPSGFHCRISIAASSHAHPKLTFGGVWGVSPVPWRRVSPILWWQVSTVLFASLGAPK